MWELERGPSQQGVLQYFRTPFSIGKPFVTKISGAGKEIMMVQGGLALLYQ